MLWERNHFYPKWIKILAMKSMHYAVHPLPKQKPTLKNHQKSISLYSYRCRKSLTKQSKRPRQINSYDKIRPLPKLACCQIKNIEDGRLLTLIYLVVKTPKAKVKPAAKAIVSRIPNTVPSPKPKVKKAPVKKTLFTPKSSSVLYTLWPPSQDPLPWISSSSWSFFYSNSTIF